MRRPTRAKVLPNDPDTTPDFYQLSLVSPLPGDDVDDEKSKGASASNNQNNFNTPAINSISSRPQVTNQSHYLQQSLPTRSIVQTAPVVGTIENFNMVPQQPMQGTIQQNFGGQQVAFVNQPFPAPHAANATTIMTIPANQNNSEVNQLNALKQRREELVRQLNGLKTQTDTMQQIQSTTEPTIMINQINPMGTIQTIQTAQPATTQFTVPKGAQFQQMVTFENAATQVGGFIQVPTYSGHQVNMSNIVGNPSPVNQQIIMQPPQPAPIGGLLMNGNVIQQPVNAPVGTIMVQNHQANPNQHFQIQGQHQFNGYFNHGTMNGM